MVEENVKVFDVELGYITDSNVRKSLEIMIGKLPSYFFHKPAASTGKYHPKYASGEGGLVRHTKAAVRFAKEMFNNPLVQEEFTEHEQSLIIMALVLHDGLKLGKVEERYTKFNHPLLMADFIKEFEDELPISSDDIEFLGKVISSHMGPWTVDYFGNDVLPKPSDKYQKFVHYCDYLASRKAIIFEFDENNNIKG